MAEIDKGLVLRLEATTLLLTKQLREASTEVEGFANRSNRAITTSSAQQQNAVKNLGFQFNDFLVQVQGGTPILRAFSQQSGQAAGALADMGGKAGATGRFFSGILGGGILTVTTLLASYLLSMGEANEALDLAKVGSTGLADAQSALGDMFDLTSGKLKTQNELLRANAQLTSLNLRSEAGAAKASSGKAFGNAGEISALPFFYKPGSNADQFAVVDAFQKGRMSARDALKQLGSLGDNGLKVSNRELQQAIIDSLAASEKEKIADLIDQSLDSGTLAGGVRRPDSKRGRKGRTFSEDDRFYQSLGFKDAADFNASVAKSAKSMEETLANTMQTLDPFPAVSGGSDAFEKSIGKSIAGVTQEVLSLNVALQDVSTPMMDLLQQIQREGENAEMVLNGIAADALEGLGDGIADAITDAKSLGEAFSNVADQIIADLIRIAVRQAIVAPLAGLLGLGGGGGGVLAGLLGFADGGDPPVGTPFIVGERGPEIMMTKSPTTVIPNHQIGGFGRGGTTISVAVDARGATDPAMVKDAAERAVLSAAPALIAAAQGKTMAGLHRRSLPSGAGG
ncbi:phage tail tape measure C-terminal domain-containing protein [Sphingomonas sp. SRS2]|uniref:phage tail tape measure C-terminal domain-containing protein n=1 Tax=Sphingomonas sp. SRS2 TaxID=133190 RepID=UPI0006184179|nr:phage tail tape measure C-terminal domain-containing protein [Sphingomonas sp. SRS2]KKC24933.1 hypothetical protein WP12_17090 [Sphingomonas sp. SRS2]